ncbi:MAG: NAD-dependent epimerase/dehydratase family protein [Gammaproteobacteria bacterium]
MRLMVTGANGFVGRILCSVLLTKKIYVNAIVRDKKGMQDLYHYLTNPENYPNEQITKQILNKYYNEFFQVIVVGDFCLKGNWCDVLEGVDGVIHLAALVHQMQDENDDAAYHQMNVQVTKRLVHGAIQKGVKRFIFMSTIKVNGEFTLMQKNTPQAFTEKHHPQPQGAYAVTKWEAENVLKTMTKNSNMDYVILRPPLVYGAEAKGNLKQLLSLLKWGVPLPLKNMNNARSFIFVRNLADAIVHCLSISSVSNGCFLVSDGEPVSTPDLIHLLCQACGYPCHLLPFPQPWLRRLCRWLGKQDSYNRLTQSLVLDDAKFRHIAQWKPPYTLIQGLRMAFGEDSNVQ